MKENPRMSTSHRLDLQTLGSQPVVMPKNLPDHWCEHETLLFPMPEYNRGVAFRAWSPRAWSEHDRYIPG